MSTRAPASRSSTTSVLRRTVIGLALTASLVAVLGAAVFVVTGYRVHGASMAPALTDGQLVFVDPLRRSPGRTDLVVYVPEGGRPTVKRVIGLPGDEVRIVPAVGVQVRMPGGEWRTVAPARGATACCAADGRSAAAPSAATVPADTLFVLGDNPAASVDSRQQGFVPSRQVRATVVAVL